jgi:hypothetical protein
MVTKDLIPLNTVAAVVEAFGGTQQMADWCDLYPSNISDWKRKGVIADNWHYKIYREALRRGYLINPKVFGDVPFADELKVLRAS